MFIERKNQQLFGNLQLLNLQLLNVRIESSITDADYLGFVNNENNNNKISDCIDDNNINNDNVSIINENIQLLIMIMFLLMIIIQLLIMK